MLIGAGVDQLCSDANTITRSHYRTLNHGIHAEFAGDIFYCELGFLVSFNGSMGDHFDLAQRPNP